MSTTDYPGLTGAEVAERNARGLRNAVEFPSSRPYRQIVRENVLTFIHLVLFGLGLSLVLIGRVSDAIATIGIITINLMVSLVQEIRAKRDLDRIALLTRPHATVRRDGGEHTVDPADIVQDDIIVARAGDQIVVDGTLVEGRLGVDESLLTGESDRIWKNPGDPVFSGAFAVVGSGVYRAEKVGIASVANQMTVGARAFRRVYTPLQREIILIIRLAVLIVVYLEVLLALSTIIQGASLVRGVQMSVVVAGLVPNGLILATTLAYALGAVRISRQGAVVQQTNAVESLANVDVLCLDKTGTLTANRLEVTELIALRCSDDAAREKLGAFVASAPAGNRTSEALAAAFPASARPVIEDVPFASEHRWSAVRFATDPESVYLLGAPDALGQAELAEQTGWAAAGQRVLLLARANDPKPLTDSTGSVRRPETVEPLALVALRDVLRPRIEDTLAEFAAAGIDLKIISGDDPQTVTAIARLAGLPPGPPPVHGDELEGLNDDEVAAVVAERQIFGRIAPRRKQQIVRALKKQGRYTAMVGDGVNDVLSLKEAHLGIALQSGSQAARAVADLVLLNDSFEVMPAAFREGQRIFNGMQNVLKIFLTRISYLVLLFLSTAIIGGFPLTPKQASLLALLTVGIPAIAFSLWARPAPIPRTGRVREVLFFVTPAAVTLSMAALSMYLFHLLIVYVDRWVVPGVAGHLRDLFAVDDALPVGQTALFLVTVLGGLLLIPFVEPPATIWHGGNLHKGDRRPTLLAVALFGVLCLVFAIEPIRTFFELETLSPASYLLIGAVVLGWALALRRVWRARLVERLVFT